MSGAIGSILTNGGALTALNGISAARSINEMLEDELSSGTAINSPAGTPSGFITAGAVAGNDALRTSNHLGRALWRRWSGYHRQSRIEI